MTEPAELFIIYEPWQVDEAALRVARGARMVCLDFLVERELKKKNIPFISLREVIPTEAGEEEWWLLIQEIAREWYRLPAMKFFEYSGIRIGEVIEPIMMSEYLTKLFYYVRIYTALKKEYPGARLSIPAFIVEDTPADGCLVSFERRVVIDAARMVGLESTVLGRPIESSKKQLSFRTTVKSLLVRTYRLFISFLPRHSFKIYASEYWSHIGPVMEQMNGCELVLMDSNELKHIPWQQLFTHRIRFRHPSDVIDDTERRSAMRISERFVKQWETAKEEVTEYLVGVRRELDWGPVLEACEYLITYASRVIADIDAVHRIMEEEKPDVVLQLASVGIQHHHFFIMAHIAAQLKIPSLELQHASVTINPNVLYSRIETDYLATYGTDTNVWHERIGHARNRLISVGSPRFDQYINEYAVMLEKGKKLFTQLGLDTTRPVLFIVVPHSVAELFHPDSYQLADFFEAIRAVQSRISGIQVLFKCRNSSYKYVGKVREHLKGLFHADYAIAGNEDIFALLCASDAVVCGNSTVIYQTLLAKKPLVLYPWKDLDACHARVYAPAAPLVRTKGELVSVLARIFTDASYREDLLVREAHFLEGCSFDGRSSERVAALLRKLPQMKRDTMTA